MKREHTLRRRLRALETLSEAVAAMRALSALHFRSARAALAAAHAYRDGIDNALSAIGISQPETETETPALLLIAADLGLCDGYNSRLTQAALEHQTDIGAQRIYCVGHRPVGVLTRANLHVSRSYTTPTSVAGLTDLLLHLAQDFLEDYLLGTFTSLHVISARFDGVGAFTPVCTQVLPTAPPAKTGSVKPSPYVSEQHLAAFAMREFLYIRLYQTLLDSLASEHGARVVATEAAGEWLTSRCATARRQLASLRREASTQEVLDIVSGAKRQRGRRTP